MDQNTKEIFDWKTIAIEELGMGKRTENASKRLGIQTAEDLLYHFPYTYEAYPVPLPVYRIPEGRRAIRVILDQFMDYSGKLPKIRTHDPSGTIWVRWFHPPYTVKDFSPGDIYVFVGEISYFHGYPQMTQPQIYTPKEYDQMTGTMQPVYPLTRGLTQLVLRKYTSLLLQRTECPETLSIEVMEKYGLCSRTDALHWIHYPKTKEEYLAAYRRIVFEEFFWFRKDLSKTFSEVRNTCKLKEQSETTALLPQLPFALTKGQKKCFSEICKKVKGQKRLNLLVQGDVGSGKTIIAILSMFLAAENGYQAVLMAPTEVLASQHYEELQRMLDTYHLDYSAQLLTGSTKKKAAIYKKICSGKIQLLVGTHAVITEKVEFSNLGLVITDEQHRFGVKQRETLEQKGIYPHNIVMSATPIPRSLGLILYGNMDICTIQDKPANRLPIKNCVLQKGDRMRAWKFLYQELEHGRQAYIICPMIEWNPNFPVIDLESYYKDLRKAFPEKYEIRILHGKMKAAEKEQIMQEFQENKVQILLSTTVVEVGVNVPNATVMLIENAERFGMSQLHQLRGRVGRGKWQSYCIFLNGSENSCERLDFMASTNDGFLIAEQDMKMRGVGEFFGEKQSGDTDFKLADIYKDSNLLQLATEAAEQFEK